MAVTSVAGVPRRSVARSVLCGGWVALLALAGCSKTSSSAATGTWNDFDPESGKVSIRMPGEPKPILAGELKDINAARGWFVESGPVTYRLSYRELSPSSKVVDQDQIEGNFDDFREMLPIVENVKKLKEKKPLSVAKVSGRELDVVTKDGKSQRIQICISGGRFYRADITGPEDAINNVDGEMFFNSFTVGR